ncbi:proteinase B Ecym_3018 [Eremothecium cymbalariae DBVPG|uniref:Peptidase S8/S53 domain-containing protein n=1 Tax=Eremothecium cymbalariae (strain CBS 270.75 / DBVPG 7215 / KCTC 17166 / NRRL Y-17582) TaxID=931890 RepID=G8JQW6_ERECY|nr:Hypothetical protein Ecym_3018 [Eremothecium cymbalariae DBVPG\
MKVQSVVLPVAVFSTLGAALILPWMDPEIRLDVGLHGRGPHGRVPPPHHHKMGEHGRGRGKGHHRGSSVLLVDDEEDKVSPMFEYFEFDSSQDFVDMKLASLSDNSRAIPHRYIVIFKDGVTDYDVGMHQDLVTTAHMETIAQLDPGHSFFDATEGMHHEGISARSVEGGIEEMFEIAGSLRGYFGYFTDGMLDLIRESGLVKLIEQDSIVHASDFETQTGAPWGLARVSHRERLNLGSFNKYLYDDNAGKGVTAYVIDTGINIDHVEFEGRAQWGKTIPSNDADYDGNGHGTHCAGTIASKTYGVAKNAKVVAVKVLRTNGTGTMSDVLRGVEYVVAEHRKASGDPNFKGSTANMSLGGGKSAALELAVDAAVAAGIHFAVAAGNENQDACNTSPASSKKCITVAASTLSDDRAYFSNWGSCVDIFAPGLNILSTYIGSDTAVATLSGTSMASPHVAGLLAYFLSLQPDSGSEYYTGSSISPEALKKKIVAYGSKNLLNNVPARTANNLIFNGGGGSLDSFWNSKCDGCEQEKVSSSHGKADDFESESLMDCLHSTSHSLFGEIRNFLDRLDLI